MTQSEQEESNAGLSVGGERMRRKFLAYARAQKEKASDEYHQEESGSFEQGIKLGRRHAMSDLMDFLQTVEVEDES